MYLKIIYPYEEYMRGKNRAGKRDGANRGNRAGVDTQHRRQRGRSGSGSGSEHRGEVKSEGKNTYGSVGRSESQGGDEGEGERKRGNVNANVNGDGSENGNGDEDEDEDWFGYGFEDGAEYSLDEFQKKSEEFLQKMFPKFDKHTNKGDRLYKIEKKFWECVASSKEEVTVEYGADLPSTQYGTGFPTIERQGRKRKTTREAEDVEYSVKGEGEDEKHYNHNDAKSSHYHENGKELKKREEGGSEGDDQEMDIGLSGWNLTRMPYNKRSLFRYFQQDYNGITSPWLYVGMALSAFCWHNEDHYTYSINYMHFGEEKTWYGIPGDQAKAFEAVVKDTVPELFETEPDLLQQLVTMVNPGLLVSKGVDVYMIDQSPGEFVVTFPQAYHAGLNTGFNFNEAVNFGPPDWLHYSRMSSEEYRNNKRMPVFSHEELVLRINYDYARRKLERPGWLVEELEYVLERELEDRQVVRDYDVKQKEIPGQENGVRRGEGGEGEERRDQEENCAECKAQLYQSYLVVDGQEPDKYCLREIGKLLDTEGITKGKITMWYKYTDEQLMRMAGRVIKGNRAERDVIKWIEKYKELRKIKTERVSLAEMRSLLHYGAYLVPASVDTSANESSGKDEDGLSTVRSCMVELNKYVEKMNYYCYLTQALLRLCNKLDVVKSCGKINGTDGIQVLDPVCMYAHNQENEQQQSQNGAHQNVPSESESKGVEVSERPNVFMELYELIMKKHNKKLNSVEWVQESVDKFGDVSANRQRGLSTWYTYGNVIKVENVYNYSVGKQRYDIVSVIDEYFKSKNLDRPKQKLNINVYPSDIELVLKEFQDNHVDCYERRVLEEWVEKARSIEALVDAKVDEVYSNKDIDSKELQMDIAELSADIKEIGLEIKNANQLGVLQSVVKWAALAQKALSNRKTLTQDKVDELISTAETQYNVPKTHKLYVKLMEIQNRVHKWDAELNQTTSSRLNLRNIATLLDKGHNLDLVPNRFSELERLKDSILVFQRGLEDILDRSIREKFSNRPSLLEAQKVYCELEAANVTSLNQTSQLKSIINDAESWQAAVRSSFVNNSGVDSDMVSVLDNVVQSTNHCYVVLQKLKNSSYFMKNKKRIKTSPMLTADSYSNFQSSNGLYCFCLQPNFDATMLSCSLCKSFYHSECLAIPPNHSTSRSFKFNCPLCDHNYKIPHLTKRPPNSLLKNLIHKGRQLNLVCPELDLLLSLVLISRDIISIVAEFIDDVTDNSNSAPHPIVNINIYRVYLLVLMGLEIDILQEDMFVSRLVPPITDILSLLRFKIYGNGNLDSPLLSSKRASAEPYPQSKRRRMPPPPSPPLPVSLPLPSPTLTLPSTATLLPTATATTATSLSPRSLQRVDPALSSGSLLPAISQNQDQNQNQHHEQILDLNEERPRKPRQRFLLPLSLMPTPKNRDLKSEICICQSSPINDPEWNSPNNFVVRCDFCRDYFHVKCMMIELSQAQIICYNQNKHPLNIPGGGATSSASNGGGSNSGTNVINQAVLNKCANLELFMCPVCCHFGKYNYVFGDIELES